MVWPLPSKVAAKELLKSGPMGDQGLDHFGLRVENLAAAAADLRTKGAVFTADPHEIRPDVQIAFLVAPGNIRVELLEKDPNRVGS